MKTVCFYLKFFISKKLIIAARGKTTEQYHKEKLFERESDIKEIDPSNVMRAFIHQMAQFNTDKFKQKMHIEEKCRDFEEGRYKRGIFEQKCC